MSASNSETVVEKIGGNVAVQSALTIIGALSGGPLAALLPVLAGSLASQRQKIRVEAALSEIQIKLSENSEKIKNISDSQYKLINESVLALLQTTNEQKIEYLKTAIYNSLNDNSFEPQEAIIISRIIRDISAEEAAFLVSKFSYKRIQLSSDSVPAQGVLKVEPGSPDGLIVTGLVSLGLLAPGENSWEDSGRLRFSPIVSKVLLLLIRH